MPRFKNPPPLHRTIYYCKVCRRAWQIYKESHENKVDYYRSHIKGDEDMICPNCEKEKKDEA